jgi:ABC-type Zn2+ transport system substrate-binding protein/surface adhesin
MQDQSDISLENVFGLEGLDFRSVLNDDDGAASDDDDYSDDDDDGSDGDDDDDDDSDDDMTPGLVCTVMFSIAIHVSFMLKCSVLFSE